MFQNIDTENVEEEFTEPPDGSYINLERPLLERPEMMALYTFYVLNKAMTMTMRGLLQKEFIIFMNIH